jgi:hypothetical protein
MTTLTMPLLPSPAALQLRGRFVELARDEAETVIRVARTSDELESVLEACLDQARLTVDALEATWREAEQLLNKSVVVEFDLTVLSRAALLVCDSTRLLLGLIQDKGEPLATTSAKVLTRLETVTARFTELRRSLDVPPVELTPEKLERLSRGIDEMRRGEGDYVEDVLARLQAGGEP